MTNMTVTAFDLYTSLDTNTLTRMKISMEGNVEVMDAILAQREGRMVPTEHPHVFSVEGKFWAYGIDCTGEYEVIAVESDFDDAVEIAESFSV